MIGKLKGVLDSYGTDWAIIDVGGVGYLLSCSARTLGALPRIGEAASVLVETFVREDMIRLFGFSSEAERDWFRLLCTVQGVGTKVALAILSTLSAHEIGNAIALQDKAMIGRANGVGKKLAERIVLELKDKAPAFAPADATLSKLQAEIGDVATTAVTDAISALVNLGYGQAQAGAAVSAALKKGGEDQPAERLIRLALKELALT